jgi:IS30 family transposase
VKARARKQGLAEQTIYRWMRQSVSMKIQDAHELRSLREENAISRLLGQREIEKGPDFVR